MTTQRSNLLGVVQVLYRWRKTLRNVCLAALGGSIVITLLMPNYYQATTIFYPASPELANPELIFGYTGDVTEYFGTDRDLDRLAEIANSNEVVDFMVTRFGLYEHYDIDSTSKRGPHKVRKRFRKLYSALKNKYDAIELSVEDTDPKLAAEMANAARGKVNELAQRMTKSSQGKLLATFEDNINRKNGDLKLLGDSLRTLQAHYNIYNVNTQSEQLSLQLATAEGEIARCQGRLEVLEADKRIPRDTIAYLKANLRASQLQRQRLMSRGDTTASLSLIRFNEASGQISVLADLHYQARKQLSYDLERYSQIKAAFNTDIPALHLVEQAEVPLIKERPVRSIIVLASVLAAFIFACIGILLAESYRDVNWRELLREEPVDEKVHV
jgi:tyrosine-protein kinase Etk/Wzc